MKGVISPTPNNLMRSTRDCCQDVFFDARLAHVDEMDPAQHPNRTTELLRPEPNGHASVKPRYYLRFHGYGLTQFGNTPIPVKAIHVQLYARLILEDPSLPDDRHLARYLMHVASDCKQSNGVTCPSGHVTMSKFKRVTNDWQPFNAITVIDRSAFEANPSPFVSEP